MWEQFGHYGTKAHGNFPFLVARHETKMAPDAEAKQNKKQNNNKCVHTESLTVRERIGDIEQRIHTLNLKEIEKIKYFLIYKLFLLIK